MFWFSSRIHKQRVIPVFRVVQYRASTQVDLREKTGMTVVSVVCNERRWYICVAPQAPLLPGEAPDEA